jgi:plasmid stabilization system protein ParE
MKKYKVQITDKASADMEAIYLYIARELQSPINAMRQYERISESIMELVTFPERFSLVKFEPERSSGLRQLRVDNFSVFFVIRGDCVIVARVLYSASDVSKRLSES